MPLARSESRSSVVNVKVLKWEWLNFAGKRKREWLVCTGGGTGTSRGEWFDKRVEFTSHGCTVGPIKQKEEME